MIGTFLYALVAVCWATVFGAAINEHSSALKWRHFIYSAVHSAAWPASLGLMIATSLYPRLDTWIEGFERRWGLLDD